MATRRSPGADSFKQATVTDIGFVLVGRGWFAGVPAPAWIALAVVVAGFLALSGMRFGRYVTAIGANTEAARRAGIPTRRYLLLVYLLTGVASAAAGSRMSEARRSSASRAVVFSCTCWLVAPTCTSVMAYSCAASTNS